MKKIAVFEKVSRERFSRDWLDTFHEQEDVYAALKLPARATAGSAGYDFYAPLDFTLAPNESIRIPTGLRVKIDDGWVLLLFPRSGLGYKFRLQMDNTVGVIDSDYYFSDNEGHIFIKITNCSTENKTVTVKKGDGFAQGIFLPFGLTADDETTALRNGGFGSTTGT